MSRATYLLIFFRIDVYIYILALMQSMSLQVNHLLIITGEKRD